MPAGSHGSGMIRALLMAALTLLATSAGAQPASAPGQAAATTPAVEPDAVAALHRMGAYLRTLKAFQVQAVTTKEDVLDDGQKIQFAGAIDLVARMPDRLRAEVANDRRERLYLYDGKSFTLWARRVNYYATIAAPPTIGQLADLLEAKYGMEVPLVDLFRWGVPGRHTTPLTAAMDVGPSQVGGVTCEHYAFRQDGLDWEIWIQRGDYPLPRKLVLTTLTDETRPQYTATFTWNLAPSVNDAAFVFDPPPGVTRIVLTEDPVAAGADE